MIKGFVHNERRAALSQVGLVTSIDGLLFRQIDELGKIR